MEAKKYLTWNEKKEIVRELVVKSLLIDRDKKMVLDEGDIELWGTLYIAIHYLGENIETNDIEINKTYDRIKKKYDGMDFWELNDDTKMLKEMYKAQRESFIKWYESEKLDVLGIKEQIENAKENLKDDDMSSIIGEILLRETNKDTKLRNDILSLNISKKA